MKHFNLFILSTALLLIATQVSSQTCEPNEMFADSTAGVYPKPITDENPDGGIDEPACIGRYYEYTLTVIIPDSVTIDLFGQELSLEIISADVPTEGAIQGLPPGIDYLCVPGNCTMPALTSGCLLLYGTVPEGTDPGDYDLSLELNITFNGLGRQTFEFPGSVFPGEYFLPVREPSHPDCMTTSSSSLNPSEPIIYPNPLPSGEVLRTVGGHQWKSGEIYRTDGTQIHQNLNSPASLQGLQLQPGVYFMTIDLGDRRHRQKLIVH